MAAIDICVRSWMICLVIFARRQLLTLRSSENDFPPAAAVAGLRWRIVQIRTDFYNLSNHGTLNKGEALRLF